MNQASTNPEDRLDLRPIILIVCFVWGLVCGFLFYFLRDEKIEPPIQNKPSETVAKPVPIEAPNLSLKPTAAAKPPAPPPPPKTPTLGDTPESTAADLKKPFPPPPPLTLTAQWGLTGQTAKQPHVPIVFKEAPKAPPAPKTTTPAADDGPELESLF